MAVPQPPPACFCACWRHLPLELSPSSSPPSFFPWVLHHRGWKVYNCDGPKRQSKKQASLLRRAVIEVSHHSVHTGLHVRQLDRLLVCPGRPARDRLLCCILVLGSFVLIGHVYDELPIACRFLGLLNNNDSSSIFQVPTWAESVRILTLCVRATKTVLKFVSNATTLTQGKPPRSSPTVNTTQRYLSAALMPLKKRMSTKWSLSLKKGWSEENSSKSYDLDNSTEESQTHVVKIHSVSNTQLGTDISFKISHFVSTTNFQKDQILPIYIKSIPSTDSTQHHRWKKNLEKRKRKCANQTSTTSSHSFPNANITSTSKAL